MLRFVLLLNALSCAIFGGLFLKDANAASLFIGNPPILLMQFLGAGLLINALLLIINAIRKQPPRIKIITFAIGDGIWVFATFVLLIIGHWITTPHGISWAIGVAIFVGLCGIAQWRLAPKA